MKYLKKKLNLDEERENILSIFFETPSILINLLDFIKTITLGDSSLQLNKKANYQ